MISTKPKSNSKGRGINRALCHLIAAFISVSAMALPAYAALTPEQIKVYGSADETQRVHFLIGRAKMGQYQLATDLLQNFPLQGPHAANRTLYVEGLILNGQGDLTGAVDKYRAALANDPSLTLVRTELAQTLVKLGENDSAKHHFKLLEADAPDAQVAANIRSFMDRLDASHPVTFSGFISIAPSTNVNSGSSHDTVYSSNDAFKDAPYLDITASKKQSGVGLAAGLSAGYSKRLGNHWEAVLAGDVSGQAYNNKNYNSLGLSQSAELRYHLANGYVGFGGIANQAIDPNASNLLTDGLTYHSYGPRVSFLRFLGQHDQISGSAVYEWRDFAGSSLVDAIDYRGELSWNHSFNSSLNMTVTSGYEKLTEGRNFASYGTAFTGVSLYKELPMGITANASLQGRYTLFDAENPYVPGMLREDERLTSALTITKRDFNIFGFAPALSYSYTRNFSNIALWDYDAHNVDFRLTKDF
jgi:outer membrane protein